MDALSSLFKKKKTPEQVVGLLKRDLMALMGEDEAELAKASELPHGRICMTEAAVCSALVHGTIATVVLNASLR